MQYSAYFQVVATFYLAKGIYPATSDKKLHANYKTTILIGKNKNIS